jgi:hypothetical protein
MAQLVLVFVCPADEWYVERVINIAEIMGFVPSVCRHFIQPLFIVLCLQPSPFQ